MWRSYFLLKDVSSEHILRAHLQTYIWLQDIVAVPNLLDPTTLVWQQLEADHYVPLVCKVPAAPDAGLDPTTLGWQQLEGDHYV